MNVAYYSADQIQQAREIDLLTYLRKTDPGNLVHVSGGEYCTREHDSLKISHGKWMWWSRGFGGASALDYLIKVKCIPFTEAVGMVLGTEAKQPPFSFDRKGAKAKRLLLPEKASDNHAALRYLTGRGIDRRILKECIERGLIYESSPSHNVIFLGFDEKKKARYAFFRSTGKDRIMGEAAGSDKRFSFRIEGFGRRIHVFEGAIDLLSYASIRKRNGEEWNEEMLLSLGGVYGGANSSKLPAALEHYLDSHLETEEIVLRLDDDSAGRNAVRSISGGLNRMYRIRNEPPSYGKDYNDELMILRTMKQERGDEFGGKEETKSRS
ncbi:DUF3991 domain-containing protein [Hornefia butyriciproducens]|uniref:DUF3991 domain-containing protein n=1 Tax=Hornefia butyriciproducens TaxID=2652293 RepID=UPI003F8901F2